MAKSMQWDYREEINLFLSGLRRRLATETRFLGKHKRLPCRVGRPVSQEELAEAIGVSRCWYALLERGVAVQPSLSMLDRLAEALNTTAEERVDALLSRISGAQNGNRESVMTVSTQAPVTNVVVVDLSGLQKFDPMFLLFLIRLRKHANRTNSSIKLIGVGPPLRRTLETTGLTHMFPGASC